MAKESHGNDASLWKEEVPRLFYSHVSDILMLTLGTCSLKGMFGVKCKLRSIDSLFGIMQITRQSF